jgi:hypothetical protein
MVNRLVKVNRLRARRLVSLLVIGSICASYVPLPAGLPPASDKDHSSPFPCQDRPCGCRSADQCWRQCCCFTDVQKLAWAKAHGVTPPDFVVVAASAAQKSLAARKPGPTRKSDSACTAHGSCCGEKCATAKVAVRSKTVAKKQPTKYVIGLLAQKCRGENSLGNLLPWAVLPNPLVLELHFDLLAWQELESIALLPFEADPPDPPPRLRGLA